MIKSFKPSGNTVTVREFKVNAEKTTESGIAYDIGENMNPGVLFGEVVESGEGTKDQPMPVSSGDKIAYKTGDGRKITVDDEELKIIDASLIIGVYTD